MPALLTIAWTSYKKITILVCCILPILISLGVWQLQRAEGKQDHLLHYQQQQKKPAINLAESLNTGQALLPYRQVFIRGKFETQRYWLLDNRSRNGQMGYEIVMPLVSDQGTVLVNRGWVKAHHDRRQLPKLVTPEEVVTIVGELYQPQKNAIFSSSDNDWLFNWPKRVLQLDLSRAEKELNVRLFPALVRINERATLQRNLQQVNVQELSFATDWPVVTVGPEKHLGYAVQWFAMALGLLFFYGWMLAKAAKESV